MDTFWGRLAIDPTSSRVYYMPLVVHCNRLKIHGDMTTLASSPPIPGPPLDPHFHRLDMDMGSLVSWSGLVWRILATPNTRVPKPVIALFTKE
jgi:hypothetical protein